MSHKTGKRDQAAYDLVSRYSLDIILNVAISIVKSLEGPCALKPCVSGKRGYFPKAMAVVALLKINEGRRFRHMSYLRQNQNMAARIGLVDIPSEYHAVIMAKIPVEYMSRLNELVV